MEPVASRPDREAPPLMAGDTPPPKPVLLSPPAPAEAAAASGDSAMDDTQSIPPEVLLKAADAGAFLQVVHGREVGRVLPLGRAELVIGRSRTCGLCLDDPAVSRRHAKVAEADDGTFCLVDLHSANGTFVNGRRVGSVTLFAGDRVQIGGTLLRFAVHDRFEQECLQQLYENATRDPLTGLLNRRSLDERLTAEWDRCRRAGRSLAVLLADLDHFHALNSAYGHPAGDEILRRFTAVAAQVLGPEAVVGRFGGEEFLALLPGCDRAEGLRTAERLRRAVEQSPFAVTDLVGRPVSVPATVSVGVAAAGPRRGGDAGLLLRSADLALQLAKTRGRNCVVGEPAEADSSFDTAILPRSSPKLGGLLVRSGVITEAELRAALAHQRGNPDAGPLGAVLIALGLCTPEEIRRAVALQRDLDAAGLAEPRDPAPPA